MTTHPSRLLGTIAFWVIFLSAISLAASVLHIKALTAFVGAVWAYLPNVIAALLIFVVAGADRDGRSRRSRRPDDGRHRHRAGSSRPASRSS